MAKSKERIESIHRHYVRCVRIIKWQHTFGKVHGHTAISSFLSTIQVRPKCSRSNTRSITANCTVRLAANIASRARSQRPLFYSVAYNDMIMNRAMDINSRIMVFYGYNVPFYDSLCDTDDWLASAGEPGEYGPYPGPGQGRHCWK